MAQADEKKRKNGPAGRKKEPRAAAAKKKNAAAGRLTAKQERFVLEMIARDNQRAAYKAAYNCQKMSDGAVDREASLLMKNPKVAKRYGELLEAARRPAEKRALNRRERVLAELEAVAFGEKTYAFYNPIGEEAQRLPSVSQRLKALELLGKSEKLFAERVGLEGEDGKLEVSIKVLGED